MGLKIGLVQVFANSGLYFPIATRKGEPYSYAKAFFSIDVGKFVVALRFLNGSLGHLTLNPNFQLEVFELDKNIPWVPTKEQSAVMKNEAPMPKELVMFKGDHVVSEVFPSRRRPPTQERRLAEEQPSQKILQRIERRVAEIATDSVSPPPEVHTTLDARFGSVIDPWNVAVANFLRQGGALQ
jgi:hypothetical protein